MQRWQNALLQTRAQVDEYVAAAHHIHLRKRGIACQIVSRKNAAVSNALFDSKARIDSRKEALQAFGRNVFRHFFTVNAAARPLDGEIANIGAKHLEGNILARPSAIFQKQ